MLNSLQPINNATADGHALFKSNLVVENQEQFIMDAHHAHKRFENAVRFNKVNSTKGYSYYNLFTLTVGSKLFFGLHNQFTTIIRDFVGTDQELWFQCWINHHMPDEVLGWHNHLDCLAHGYMSLDPKNTSTVFESYTIKNEVGKIYIGPSDRPHKVVVHEPYDTPRLTIAFNVIDSGVISKASEKYGFDISLSHIPVK